MIDFYIEDLTPEEIRALTEFDASTLPPLVASAIGVLMRNHACAVMATLSQSRQAHKDTEGKGQPS